ncbi:hypothetical protein NF681_11455 [Comamonadaceae bacterium OTU4NAUVB1]|nr:hypothetical protein NF681_11455 [Comamonadaceae bacterium OTU4NAUVB1]
MSIIALPINLLVSQHSFGLHRYDLTYGGGDTGTTQTTVLGFPRRTCSLASPELISDEDAARWRTLLHALGGRVNHLAVHDRLNSVPRGTARGTWTASAAAAAGAKTMVIRAGADQAGKTLLAGDWFGVNQGGTNRQMLHVQADTVVDGSGLMAVSFETVLRSPVVANSAIAWSYPTCLMKSQSDSDSWSVSKGKQGGFSLDLLEQWY